MSSPFQAAVDMAAAILLGYADKYGPAPFPVVKDKLWPLIEFHATKNGVDNIYVKRFDEPTTPIVGQVRRITESNGVYEPVENHGVIYLCPSLDNELSWQRFIQVKESAHLLLDKPSDYVHSATDVDSLLVCLAQFGAQGITTQYASEMRAVVCATEILFPKATRDLLRGAYSLGLVSPAKIGKAALIPAEQVRFAMQDEYVRLVDALYP